MEHREKPSFLSRWKGGLAGQIILVIALSGLFFLRGPDFVWKLWDHLADPGDAVFTSWLLAWDAHALLTPGVSLWDAPILFPAANTLALSENMLGNIPVTLPAYLLTDNATFAANCLVIFAFVFSAVALFLLVRRLTGSFLAGLVSAICFPSTPTDGNTPVTCSCFPSTGPSSHCFSPTLTSLLSKPVTGWGCS